jgi:hypothetical protein
VNISAQTTIALIAALACGCSGRPTTNNYGAAAAGLGVAVAGTVVYRAVTGGSVAACTPGNICDRQSGLCVPSECSPTCPESQHCVRDFDGRLYCEDDGLTSSLIAARKRAADAGARDVRAADGVAVEAGAPADGG